jgi:hypothetical protein
VRCPALALLALSAAAQPYSQRGFLEFRNFLYPQTAATDRARFVSEALLRYEAGYQAAPTVKLNLSLDARFDSHRQFAREARLDVLDQNAPRPALSLRRASLTWHRGGATVEAGRQFVRWGKADLLNPTDRFAPRDYLNPLLTDYLGVTAARLTYERGPHTLDLVFVPLFTPSRVPLLGQRWAVLPEGLPPIALRDEGARYPGRGQAGLRFSRAGAGHEFSVSYYDGFYHLPAFDAALRPPATAGLQRRYPRLRLYGGDMAVPLPWFTLKSEAGFFQSNDRQVDEFLQYVIQLERISGEWVFVGGYAGEYVTRERSSLDFNPERGIARTILGRASYNLDANRTVAFEGALRQDGNGAYGRFEFTQALGAHWRATAGFVLLRGSAADFLGQYRRNSNVTFALRYSF